MKQVMVFYLVVTALTACSDKGSEPNDNREVVPVVGKYELTIATCKGKTIVRGANCSTFSYCSSNSGETFQTQITYSSSQKKVTVDSFDLDFLSQTRIGSPQDHVPNPGSKNTSPDYSYWPECVYYFKRDTPYVGDWTGLSECGGYDMDGTLVCTSSNEWSLHRTGDL